MAKVREFPRDMQPDDNQVTWINQSDLRPATPIEALMQTAPHRDVDVSRAERLPLKDIIADAVDQLTEEQRWIFDALFYRKLSLRELGRELSLSKTSIARKRDRLLRSLRNELADHPTIKEYIGGR